MANSSAQILATAVPFPSYHVRPGIFSRQNRLRRMVCALIEGLVMLLCNSPPPVQGWGYQAPWDLSHQLMAMFLPLVKDQPVVSIFFQVCGLAMKLLKCTIGDLG